MPITLGELLKVTPELAKSFRPATVTRKRRAVSMTGGLHDRRRFVADVRKQIELATAIQADNVERKLTLPTMPFEKRTRGARKYWFDVNQGIIFVQLFLGNLALLEAQMEADDWQSLITGLEALIGPTENGDMDVMFARRRDESRSKRAEAEAKRQQDGVVAAAASEEPPKARGRRKAQAT